MYIRAFLTIMLLLATMSIGAPYTTYIVAGAFVVLASAFYIEQFKTTIGISAMSVDKLASTPNTERVFGIVFINTIESFLLTQNFVSDDIPMFGYYCLPWVLVVNALIVLGYLMEKQIVTFRKKDR